MKDKYYIVFFDELKRFNKHKFENLFNSYPWLLLLKKTYSLKIIVIEDKRKRIQIPFSIIDNSIEKTIKSLPFSDYSLLDVSHECLISIIHFLQESFPGFQIMIKLVYEINQHLFKTSSKIQINEIGFLNQICLENWKQKATNHSVHERNVIKAKRQGVKIRKCNSMKSIKTFYELHLKLRVYKFRKMPQPYYFFENLYKIFLKTNQGFILEAYYRGKVIASWIILCNKNTLYYKFGASDPAFLYVRPNDLLFRELIFEGLKGSFQNIDMGYSGNGESYKGLIRFKGKEGGDIRPILESYYTPDHYNSDKQKTILNETNKIVKEAIIKQDLNRVRKLSESIYHLFA